MKHIHKALLCLSLVILGFFIGGQTQSIKDEDIKLQLSKDSPLKGKTVLVFPSASEYRSMDKDEDLKFLVDTINSYLAELDVEYVDYKRSLEMSKKFMAVYEEKKGQAMTLAQMLANEIKAPVYMEVDITVKSEPHEKYKGWTVVEGIANIKAYDSSTARGLGNSQSGQKLVNNASDDRNARRVVLTYIAKKTLQDLLPKIEKYLMKGEKIELRVIGLKDLKAVKDFSTFLNTLPGIQEVKRKSVSGDLAVFDVTYGGGVESFLNDLADLAITYPEYEKMKVDQTGNSVSIKL
ncbi:MAG: DUF6175 family protein [Spirochaetia bacterium]|nr:DUF6175 family protein [Spirochaetota bacterium]MCX8096397.1 DUF6175 family protein [Spirochaetota bacterium]MDW8112704.1 DUF6175 family protein [Spirochaetia bacterium]